MQDWRSWSLRYDTASMLQRATAVAELLDEAEAIILAHYQQVCDLYDEPTITHADVLAKLSDSAS